MIQLAQETHGHVVWIPVRVEREEMFRPRCRLSPSELPCYMQSLFPCSFCISAFACFTSCLSRDRADTLLRLQHGTLLSSKARRVATTPQHFSHFAAEPREFCTSSVRCVCRQQDQVCSNALLHLLPGEFTKDPNKDCVWSKH